MEDRPLSQRTVGQVVYSPAVEFSHLVLSISSCSPTPKPRAPPAFRRSLGEPHLPLTFLVRFRHKNTLMSNFPLFFWEFRSSVFFGVKNTALSFGPFFLPWPFSFRFLEPFRGCHILHVFWSFRILLVHNQLLFFNPAFFLCLFHARSFPVFLPSPSPSRLFFWNLLRFRPKNPPPPNQTRLSTPPPS